jgi:hypothetical protein
MTAPLADAAGVNVRGMGMAWGEEEGRGGGGEGRATALTSDANTSITSHCSQQSIIARKGRSAKKDKKRRSDEAAEGR